MLSAVIIARDEGDRIEDAIRSVAFADEVLVVDSGSTDDTVAKARALGARVVETDWPGHVAQKNRAFDLATHDWVLSIDADERVSPELAASIRAARPGTYRVLRRNVWLGHPLRHGRMGPEWKVRLAPKTARWTGDDPHDRLDLPAEPLAGDLIHVPYRDLDEHLATIARYSAMRRGSTLLDVIVRPPWHFVSAYVLKGGFLDGVPGLCVAALGAMHTLLAHARARGLAK
jgi:glycosyltransferase involved in cell wall biosynthesis